MGGTRARGGEDARQHCGGFLALLVGLGVGPDESRKVNITGRGAAARVGVERLGEWPQLVQGERGSDQTGQDRAGRGHRDEDSVVTARWSQAARRCQGCHPRS